MVEKVDGNLSQSQVEVDSETGSKPFDSQAGSKLEDDNEAKVLSEEEQARLKAEENLRRNEIFDTVQPTYIDLDGIVHKIVSTPDSVAQMVKFEESILGETHLELHLAGGKLQNDDDFLTFHFYAVNKDELSQLPPKYDHDNIKNSPERQGFIKEISGKTEKLKLTEADDKLFQDIVQKLNEDANLLTQITRDLLAVQGLLRDAVNFTDERRTTEEGHIASVYEGVTQVDPLNPLLGLLAIVHDDHKLRPQMHLFLHEITSAVAGSELLIEVLDKNLQLSAEEKDRLKYVFKVIISLHGVGEFPYNNALKNISLTTNEDIPIYGLGFSTALYPFPPQPEALVSNNCHHIQTTARILNAVDAARSSAVKSFIKNSGTYVNDLSSNDKKLAFAENILRLSLDQYLTGPIAKSFEDNLKVWGIRQLENDPKYAENIAKIVGPLRGKKQYYDDCVRADSGSQLGSISERTKLYLQLQNHYTQMQTLFSDNESGNDPLDDQENLKKYSQVKSNFETALAAYITKITQEYSDLPEAT